MAKPKIYTAGIAVDNWKLPVYRDRLTKAGYAYEDAGALSGDTTLLKVKFTIVAHLGVVVAACEAECTRNKASK